MKSEIFFLKTRNVKFPSRGTVESAGIDFYVPYYSEEFKNILAEKNPDIGIDSERIYLEPGERVLIPSGIKCAMGPDRALIAHNKSGVASKKGLDVLANTIDADYKGEIHINLVNTSDRMVVIEFGEKIIQFIEMPIFISSINEIQTQEELDKYYRTNQRNSGGFGHTGNN